MPTFSLDVGISPQSIIELEDCALLLKWRTGMAMNESEIEDLVEIINNFDRSSQILIKMPWGSE